MSFFLWDLFIVVMRMFFFLRGNILVVWEILVVSFCVLELCCFVMGCGLKKEICVCMMNYLELVGRWELIEKFEVFLCCCVVYIELDLEKVNI